MVCLAAAAFALFAPPAHAYLDGNTGSMIFQAIAGAALGIGVFFKLFWRRISAAVSRVVGRRRET